MGNHMEENSYCCDCTRNAEAKFIVYVNHEKNKTNSKAVHLRLYKDLMRMQSTIIIHHVGNFPTSASQIEQVKLSAAVGSPELLYRCF